MLSIASSFWDEVIINISFDFELIIKFVEQKRGRSRKGREVGAEVMS